MKITVSIIAISIAIFIAPVYGEDVKVLIDILQKSMTQVADYGNNFVGPLKERLEFEYSMVKEDLDFSVNQLYNSSLTDVKSAEKLGVDASICVKGLKEELETIVKDKFPGFEYCMNHTMKFAMEFAPFIQNQGNTGYIMIEGLQSVIKKYSSLPNSQAEKCYEGLDWYTSAVSHNYAGTSSRYLMIGKTLHDYLSQSVLNCFQRPIELIREKLLKIDNRVIKCIADKIANDNNSLP